MCTRIIISHGELFCVVSGCVLYSKAFISIWGDFLGFYVLLNFQWLLPLMLGWSIHRPILGRGRGGSPPFFLVFSNFFWNVNVTLLLRVLKKEVFIRGGGGWGSRPPLSEFSGSAPAIRTTWSKAVLSRILTSFRKKSQLFRAILKTAKRGWYL